MDITPNGNGSEDCEAAINKLPDEITLKIFANVIDGSTILDILSLVCKRWLALARDYEAWMGVKVVLDWTGSALDLHNAARVLLHAPALRLLSSNLEQPMRKRDRQLLQTALHRSRAVVQAMQFVSPAQIEIDLIQRNPNLRSLSLEVYHAGDEDDSLTPKLLRVLSTLKQLHELHLHFNIIKAYQYSGELAAGLPLLKRISVTMHVMGNDKTIPTELVRDLLRGSSVLGHFACSFKYVNQLMPTTWVECLMKCVHLRSLDICVLDLHAVRYMKNLEKLKLYFSDSGLNVTPDTISRQTEIVKHCVSLSKLQNLDIELRLTKNFPRDQVEKLLLALVTAAPHTKKLRLISLGTRWNGINKFRIKFLIDLIALLPELQMLDVNCFPITGLSNQLTANQLPHLRRVSGNVLACSEKEAMLLKKTVSDIMVIRPDVEVALDVQICYGA